MTDDTEAPDLPQTSWSASLWPNLLFVAVGLTALVFALMWHDPVASLMYGVAGFVLLMTGALKLIRRPRLAVVDGDLAVRGLRSVRYIPPTHVVEIRLIGVPRFGLRQQIMRIEYSDEDRENRLEILSKGDLGADPTEVARTLGRLGFSVRESDLPTDPRDAE